MNLQTETKRKLKSWQDRLEDLNGTLTADFATEDMLTYTRGEIVTAKKNIEYYSSLLIILNNLNEIEEEIGKEI